MQPISSNFTFWNFWNCIIWIMDWLGKNKWFQFRCKLLPCPFPMSFHVHLSPLHCSCATKHILECMSGKLVGQVHCTVGLTVLVVTTWLITECHNVTDHRLSSDGGRKMVVICAGRLMAVKAQRNHSLYALCAGACTGWHCYWELKNVYSCTRDVWWSFLSKKFASV